MSRETRDVVGFRRIFVLFCTLVLLPAMLMSGFAIVAMRNEHNVEKLRQRERVERLLFRAESALLATLEATDQAVRFELARDEPARALVVARAQGMPVGAAVVLAPDGAVLYAEAPLDGGDAAALLVRVASVGTGLGAGERAHFDVARAPRAGVVSVQRLDDGRVLGYLLDDDVLAQRLVRDVPPDGAVRATLDVVEHDEPRPEVGAVERLMADLMKSAARAADETPTRTLDEPFARYSVRLTGAPRSAAARITAIYVVLLLVFYATLITGVVLISRLVWQEARLSALKTDFVSHVSHELRSPLTSIRMFIETLKRGRASPREQEECLELLARETERLSEMIERVLGYARLKSGRRQFNVTAVRVREVVDDALDAFQTHLLGESHASLELSSDVPDELPRVLADRGALVEALINLLGNAYKYTGPDKRIRVFARAAKKRIIVGVEDNGPGLPKSEHKRVFERFYQARNLLTRTAQGSGLGLAITKGIVVGLGGRIHVESEPGKGATFVIELKEARGMPVGEISP